jgi:hypothetical protein
MRLPFLGSQTRSTSSNKIKCRTCVFSVFDFDFTSVDSTKLRDRFRKNA